MRQVQAVVTMGLLATLAAACMKTDKESAIANGAKPLTKTQAEKQLIGNTMKGSIMTPQATITYSVYFSPDGRTTGKAMTDRDHGTWKFQDDGKVCITWGKWQEAKETCTVYYKDGEQYKVFSDRGATTTVARVVKGNPEKLSLDTDKTLAEKQGLAKLDGATLREKLRGNTLSGVLKALNDAKYHVFYAEDGKTSGKLLGPLADTDKGAYRIEDNGDVCVKWNKWANATENCGPIFAAGDELKMFDPSGGLAVVAKLRDGNPESL